MRYRPTSSVLVVRLWLVAIELAVTVTPGMTAPVGSVTVPVNADVPADWARHAGAMTISRIAMTDAEQLNFIVLICPPLFLYLEKLRARSTPAEMMRPLGAGDWLPAI